MGSFFFPPLLFHYVISGLTGAKDPVGKIVGSPFRRLLAWSFARIPPACRDEYLVAKITPRPVEPRITHRHARLWRAGNG